MDKAPEQNSNETKTLEIRWREFSSTSSYANLNVSKLCVEQLVSIYKEVKEKINNLKKLTELEYEIASDLRTIINNMIIKDIEVAKIIIMDLIENENAKSHINIHELIESFFRFETIAETKEILSEGKIFYWFFGEYKSIYRYERYVSDAKRGAHGDIIFESANNVLLFLIKQNENEKMKKALSLFTQSMSKEDKELFFKYFASKNSYFFNENNKVSSIQKELISNFIYGLSNEESLKTLLGLNCLNTDEIMNRLSILKYDMLNEENETRELLEKLQKLNPEAFEVALVNMVKINAQHTARIKKITYNLEFIFRSIIVNKKNIILNNKELRYQISKNYKLGSDFLPINCHEKAGTYNEDRGKIAIVIKEMIDANIEFKKFDAFDFFYHCSIDRRDKEIVKALIQILYELIYAKKIEEKSYLEYLLFYYVDVLKIVDFNIDAKFRNAFYKILSAKISKHIIVMNKLIIKNKGYNESFYEEDSMLTRSENRRLDLLKKTLPMLFQLTDFKKPNSSFEVLLEILQGNFSNDMAKKVFLDFFWTTLDCNLEAFIIFIYENELMITLKEFFDIKNIRKRAKNIQSRNFIFVNDDYIVKIHNIIVAHKFSKKGRKRTSSIVEINFFKDLLQGVIYVNENDSQYSYYLNKFKTNICYGDGKDQEYLNTVVSIINELEEGVE